MAFIDIPRFIRSCRRGGLTTRIMLLSIVPAAILATALIAVVINERINELTRNDERDKNNVTQQLAEQLYSKLAESQSVESIESFLRLQMSERRIAQLVFSASSSKLNLINPDEKQRDLRTYTPGPNNPLARKAAGLQLLFSNGELEHAKQSLWRTTLAVATVCFVAFLGLLAWQARRLSVPLKNIVNAVEDLSRGKMDTQVVSQGTGELRALEDGVNCMARSMRETQRNLENQIDLATAHLRQQRDEATRASAAKSRFLAAASHDLRQPMHALGLFCTALAQKIKTSEHQALIGNIQLSLHAMEDLFEALLDISRLDAGRVQADVQPLALAEVLQWVNLEYSDAALDKGLRFRVRPSDRWVQADITLLRRILLNLCANAIRYTREGGILIAARTRKDKVVLEVWDTGIGIDAAKQALIFDEFVQLDNPERDRTKGMGLGLSIAQKSAELMGTRIEVRSAVGRGTVFRLALPLAQAPIVTHAPATPLSSGNSLMGRRLLLVEDDAISREAMTVLLNEWGCQVLASESGKEAIAALIANKFTPEIVISDFRLRADETGLSVIQLIREHLGVRIPALIVTGELEFATLVGDRNAQWVLKKPVDAWQLRQAILEGLANHAQEQFLGSDQRRANRLLRHGG